MSLGRQLVPLAALIALFTGTAWAVNPSSGEMSIARKWFDARFAARSSEQLFSFIYNGVQSAALLKTWGLNVVETKLDDNRTQRVLTYTDPTNGLAIRCVGICYRDFPTVEWTIYFKNTRSADTLLLEGIKALDGQVSRGSAGEFVLHYIQGANSTANDYQPVVSTLRPSEAKTVAPTGGLSCNGVCPYFNIEWPSAGMIVAIGWQGQWSMKFTRDSANGLQLQAGQETTHFKLHPGEEVRTPMAVVQFYNGDAVRGQNIWRRWMIAHNMPQPGGIPLTPALNGTTGFYTDWGNGASETNQIEGIDRYAAHGISVDGWWLDAGWYKQNQGWPQVGTWEPDPVRFPNGLGPVGDHAHSKGLKLITWFEPGRVMPGTDLYINHPEWMLPNATTQDWPGSMLVDLGNSDALNWLINRYDRIITTSHIDIYRQDFNNTNLLPHWRAKDEVDRQGITEIRYVQGSLRLYDELIRRHPNLLVDNCSAGGRRNDVETLRRSVPLWRSDCFSDAEPMQFLTYGIASWIPYFGTGTDTVDTYNFRSHMMPSLMVGWDLRRSDLDYSLLQSLASQWRKVADNYLGDYYPLTTYNQGDDSWIAWQFDRPEVGQGLVQVFRHANSAKQSDTFRLCGLNRKAVYELTDLDTDRRQQMTGQQLMEDGLTVNITGKPGAAVYSYKWTNSTIASNIAQ